MKTSRISEFKVKEAYSTIIFRSSTQNSLNEKVKIKFEKGEIDVYQLPHTYLLLVPKQGYQQTE